MHDFGEQAAALEKGGADIIIVETMTDIAEASAAVRAAPFHFNAKQWLITGAATGITAGPVTIGNDIDDWDTVRKAKHKRINSPSPVITEFGSNTGLLYLKQTVKIFVSVLLVL